ncbi:MAG: hypothetical protein IJP62_05710, partial [Treponema sp.]|nr:hypothetical protein [Treponema sp.]
DLKARLSALLADDEDVQPLAAFETPIDFVSETTQDFSADVMTKELTTGEMSMATTDDLPIYEATAAQINYWHAFGCNGFLQDFLREYDLDYASANVAAYNHFKIGLDEKRHVATFAIDDTHYYAIQFNEWNTAPMNEEEARLVLEKISSIRIATSRYKDFCGFQIECFD